MAAKIHTVCKHEKVEPCTDVQKNGPGMHSKVRFLNVCIGRSPSPSVRGTRGGAQLVECRGDVSVALCQPIFIAFFPWNGIIKEMNFIRRDPMDKHYTVSQATEMTGVKAYVPRVTGRMKWSFEWEK